MYPVNVINFGINCERVVSYFACFLIKRIVLRSRFSLCSVGICIHVMLCKTKQGQSVVGAYETHFFTIKLLKVENNSVFLLFGI